MSRRSAMRRPARTPEVAAAKAAQSLDPADWTAYRAKAHAALDLALDHVAKAAQRPVWQPVPDLIKQASAAPLPAHGQGLDKTIEDTQRLILP